MAVGDATRPYFSVTVSVGDGSQPSPVAATLAICVRAPANGAVIRTARRDKQRPSSMRCAGTHQARAT